MVRENQIVIAVDRDVYACNSCNGRRFNSEHSLLQHCRYAGWHEGEWCERCRWMFVHPHARENHVQSSLRHWVCNICHFDGMSQAALRHHLADEHDFCLDCQASFWSFEQHRREDHNRCTDCRKEFATRNELLMHEQVHMHRDKECYGCDKMFKSPSGILIHLESRTCPSRVTPAQIEEWAFEHYESDSYTNNRFGYNKYRCPECDMNFPKVSALLQHVESPACSADYGYRSTVEELRAYIEEQVEDMRENSSDDYFW